MKSKANRRTARTIIQFILGGGFLAFINAAANGLSPFQTAILLAASTLTVTWVQNYAEDHEILNVILPAPPSENLERKYE